MVEVTLGITDDHLAEVYAHPSMRRLKTDHAELSPIIHPLVRYYSAWNNGEFVGAFMVVKNTPLDSEIHILLFPKAAIVYRDLCKIIIDETLKESNRVTAKIFSDLYSTINLVQKLGFTYEGRIREMFEQNGIKKDVFIYGLLKSEWEE